MSGQQYETMTSNGEQFTAVDRCCMWSECAVEGGLMLWETEFVLLWRSLFCPWGTVNFVFLESQCFPWLRLGKHRDSRETIFTDALGSVNYGPSEWTSRNDETPQRPPKRPNKKTTNDAEPIMWSVMSRTRKTAIRHRQKTTTRLYIGVRKRWNAITKRRRVEHFVHDLPS